MNIKKLLPGAALSAIMLLASAIPALASKSVSLFGPNWKILDRVTLPNGSVNFMTRHPDVVVDGGLAFPLLDESKGYTSYMLLNWNNDLTDKTIRAVVSTSRDPSASFVANPAGCGAGTGVAAVGLEFQDTSAGTYDSNDYWWSTQRPTLESLISGGTLVASLSLSDENRANWINQSGKPATDKEENWVEWQGDVVAMSPYDGFTKAMKKVKEVSFSFGDQCAYARGVAVSDGNAAFQLLNYQID